MSRALVGLALLALVGCRATVDVEKVDAGPFPCRFGAGGQQCLHGWLCGLDNRCFDPAQGQAQPCRRDGGADVRCPGDWLCGVDEVCFDPRQGQARRCLRDAGAENGCGGGWRCGYDSVCFDPETQGEASCQWDDQCGARWRCNVLDRRCQQRGVPRAYGCAADRDCESTPTDAWACNVVAQRCERESDRVAPPAVAAWLRTDMNPARPGPAPLRLAIGPWVRSPGLQTEAVSLRAAISESAIEPTMHFASSLRTPDGGDVEGLPLPSVPVRGADVTEVAFAGDVLVLSFVDGGLSTVAFVQRGRSSLRFDPTPLTPVATGGARALGLTQCEVGNGTRLEDELGAVATLDDGSALVLQRAHDGFGVFGDDGGVLLKPVALGCQTVDGGCATIPVSARPTVLCAQRLIHLDAQARFWVSERSWTQAPVEFVAPQVLPTGATLPADLQVLDVEASDAGWALTGRYRSPDAGERAFGLGLLAVPGTGDPQPIPIEYGFTAPSLCPLGGPVLQVASPHGELNRLTDQSFRRSILARCGALPDAGVPEATWRVAFNAQGGGSNQRNSYAQDTESPATWSFGVTRVTSRLRLHAHGGRDGRVWLADDPASASLASSADFRPGVLDRLPETVVDVSPLGLFAVTAGYMFPYTPGLGFGSRRGRISTVGFEVVGAFVGPIRFIVDAQGLLLAAQTALGDEVPRLVVAMPPGQRLSGPASAQLWGGTIFVAGGDTLYSADVSRFLVDPLAEPTRLAARLVPSPGLRIRSVALSGADGGTPSVTMTTAAGAFHAIPIAAEQWQLEPLALPVDLGSPVRALGNGAQARLILSSGRVLTVPNRVLLSEALAGGARVVDVTTSCADTVALTTDGLQRLVGTADAGLEAKARWEPLLALSADGGVPANVASGRFFENGDTLFVGFDDGRVVRVQPATGCR